MLGKEWNEDIVIVESRSHDYAGLVYPFSYFGSNEESQGLRSRLFFV